MDTKEKLFITALHLFSEKGYTATSIRDICYANDVKESTVYYYFKNKQAILDAMQERFCQNAEEVLAQLNAKIANPTQITRDTFFAICDLFVESYLTDDFNNRFIRIMRLEQGCNDSLRDLYHKWMFDMPVQYAAELMEKLMELGFINENSSAYLAFCFYTPIFFCYERSYAFGEPDDKTRERLKRLIYSHLQNFLQAYATAKYL
ncbi:MAG: TetR/AcrR family transcriptional regulator [Oscillospiraceae bacterium]